MRCLGLEVSMAQQETLLPCFLDSSLVARSRDPTSCCPSSIVAQIVSVWAFMAQTKIGVSVIHFTLVMGPQHYLGRWRTGRGAINRRLTCAEKAGPTAGNGRHRCSPQLRTSDPARIR